MGKEVWAIDFLLGTSIDNTYNQRSTTRDTRYKD
jgi:hypothetical protein